VLDSEATLPGEQLHSAHFNSDFQGNFSQFGTALVSQLVTVPLPSPASGFTYQLDPSTGVLSAARRAPILAERGRPPPAALICLRSSVSPRHRRGPRSDRIPAVFTHDSAQLLAPPGRRHHVNSITANVNQYTTFFTLASPTVDISIAADMNTIRVCPTPRSGAWHDHQLTHFFRLANGDIGDRRLATARPPVARDLTVRFAARSEDRHARGQWRGPAHADR
jgi:hypothetical protein